jgi:hypothetical protein
MSAQQLMAARRGEQRMKSIKSVPFRRGLLESFPARGGPVLGSLGMAWLFVEAVFTVARMINDPSNGQPPLQGLLTILSVAAIVYSIQINPKGTRKSPLAF